MDKSDLSIRFLVLGFGSGFLYMASLMTNMNNFAPQHRGKVVGILDGSFSAGPALTALIYGFVFVDGHVEDQGKQNLKGFYLSSAILLFTVCILSILFLRSFQSTKELEITRLLDEDDNQEESCISVPVRQIAGWKLFKTFNFQFILWSSVFASSVQLVVQSNIGTYLKSFHLDKYTTLFTTINPISQVGSKIFAGFLSDLLIAYVPRVTIVLGFTFIQAVFLTICIFFPDHFAVLLFLVIVVGMANGSLWCITPTITGEYYGIKYFGRNWGLILTATGLGAIVLQELYGWTYEMAIPFAGQNDCYGSKCFTWSFTMHAVLSFCSSLFYFGVYQNHSR